MNYVTIFPLKIDGKKKETCLSLISLPRVNGRNLIIALVYGLIREKWKLKVPFCKKDKV